MTSEAENAKRQEREQKHRSLYGLIFVAVVYVGVLVMLGVAWPRFVEDMLAPRLRRDEAQAKEQGDASAPAPAGEKKEVEAGDVELPPAIGILYAGATRVQKPLWWGPLAIPLLLGIAFEVLVKSDRTKTFTYYATSALVGVAILVGAGLVIFEVLGLVQPSGGA
ncbi:MAG: hypothetical protein HY720_22180 [Planctomycetes bacterium]|nr:hypothetical protein [Planctomycetota bacterium]